LQAGAFTKIHNMTLRFTGTSQRRSERCASPETLEGPDKASRTFYKNKVHCRAIKTFRTHVYLRFIDEGTMTSLLRLSVFPGDKLSQVFTAARYFICVLLLGVTQFGIGHDGSRYQCRPLRLIHQQFAAQRLKTSPSM
jgi:hypothetical protein